MAVASLDDAFHEELRDVLSAERQLTKALPKLAKGVTNEQLKAAMATHLEETKEQVARLEQVFELLEQRARAKKCEAMEGLIAEAQSILEMDAAPEVLDALIIAAAQKVEHYEIATYGTLCSWAKLLGHNEALALLKQTLNEEETTDKKLSQLSAAVNEAALQPAE